MTRLANITCFLLLFSYCSSLTAQIDIGPTLSFSASSFNGFNNSSAQRGDSYLGFQIGAFARGVIGKKAFLQGNLDYSFSGLNAKTSPTIDTYKFQTVNLMAQIGSNIGKLRFQAGPVLRFLVSAKEESQNVEIDAKEAWTSASLGYNLGLGVDLGAFDILLSYQSSFDDITERGSILNPGSLKYTQLIFTMSYDLFKIEKKAEKALQ